jgi:pyruvate dehydrogenase E1 component alpha subunit
MHMFSKEKHFYGGHGIVGAQVPIGAGWPSPTSISARRQVSARPISATARRIRARSESFNMAKLWDLPVVYVIENNQYAMGTPCARQLETRSLGTRRVLRHPGEEVDGMDVTAVYDAVSRAVEHCALRQRALHPRDEDLPLSRPLHVRSREIPHPR